MSDPPTVRESGESREATHARGTDRQWAGCAARAYDVMVYANPDQYAASELIAGASLAQEHQARCVAVFVRRTTQGLASPAGKSGMTRLNEQLAEMLGAEVVNLATEEPAQAAIDFVKTGGISHVVLSSHADQRRAGASRTVQRFAATLRGVEVRVVAAAGLPARAARPDRLEGEAALAAALLLAMLLVATAAIVYVSWPIVFTAVITAATIWCWRLEQPPSKSDPTRPTLLGDRERVRR